MVPTVPYVATFTIAETDPVGSQPAEQVVAGNSVALGLFDATVTTELSNCFTGKFYIWLVQCLNCNTNFYRDCASTGVCQQEDGEHHG